MTVKEIIIRALNYVGREDVASKCGETELAAEEAGTIETMLYCFNAVEDELARNCFPLVYSEDCTAVRGKLDYEYFRYKPAKILSVTADGKSVAYTAYSTYLTAKADLVTVTYEYSPQKKSIDGNCDLPDDKISVKMLAAGAASEYCIINGEMKQAEFWENVYRDEIKKVLRKKFAHLRFGDRRWL